MRHGPAILGFCGLVALPTVALAQLPEAAEDESASQQAEERKRADDLHRAIAGTANDFERKKVTPVVGHDVLSF